MVFNGDLLPHMQAYIRSLPKGLDSYPRCAANVTLLRPFLDFYPKLGSQNAVPSVLREVVKTVKSGSVTSTIPEAYFVALMCLIRDIECSDDAKYLQIIASRTDTISEAPILKRFVHTVSPKLIMLGARMMWSTLHPGTTLTAAENTKTTQTALLTYDPFLFNQLYLRGIAASLQSMFAHTKVKDPRITVVKYTPISCQLAATWNPA